MRRRRKFFVTLSVGCSLIGQAHLSFGQGADQSQTRADLLRTPVNPTYTENSSSASGEDQGYAVSSPNDEDLGQQAILKRAEQYRAFTLLVGAPFYYTSNVALTRSGEEDDVIFAPVLNFVYQPRITKTFYGEVAVQHQVFLYDRFSEFNFHAFDAIAGFVYYLPQAHNLILRARYDYNRLTDTDHYDEFFVDHSIFLGAELPFRFGRAQQLSLGADTNLTFYAHPDGPQRNDFEFYLGYSANLSRAFSVDAVARLAVRDYYVGDRTDVSEIFALSATYRIRDWLSASFISTFAWNQSNQDVFDYSVANVGGALSLTAKF